MLLLKDEFPPPRYAIEGDYADSDFPLNVSREIKLETSDLKLQTLVLVANKCAGAVDGLLAKKLFRIKLVVESQSNPVPASSGFYETDGENYEYTNERVFEFPVYQGPKNVVFLLLCPLTSSDSAYFGRQIIDKLNPAMVLVLAPGQSFMDVPVAYLETQQPAKPIYEPSGISRASPPVLVQGASAAAMVRAQQKGIPGLTLVVTSDGPCDYEVVQPAHLDVLRKDVYTVLQQKLTNAQRVERDMSFLYV